MHYNFYIFLLFGFFACQYNNISDQEEWIALFNGEDLSDWTIKFANQDLDVNFRNTFRVKDRMIRISYDAYNTFDDAYAHMYFKKPFSYYKLRFDYRFTGQQVKGGENWNVRNLSLIHI